MVRDIEVRVIEQIERFCAKLQTMALLAQDNVLVHREIHVLQSRPGHDIAAGIAKLPGRRLHEGASVKPTRRLVYHVGGQPALRDGGVAGGVGVRHHRTRHIGIRDHIRPVRIAKGGDGRPGLRCGQVHRKRRPRLRRQDSSRLPVA